MIRRCSHISNIDATLLKTKPKLQACNQVFNHSTYLYHCFLCVTCIASEILCPNDVFDEPLPSAPSPIPVALPVPSPVCLSPMSPLALPTVPATISQHMYAHVGFYVRTVLSFIIQSNCYGCEVDHPSQRQHSCLMDDPQDQFNMYIEEMLEKLRKG